MKYIKRFELNKLNYDINTYDWVALKNDTLINHNYSYFINNPCQVLIMNNYVDDELFAKVRCNNDDQWIIQNYIEYHSKNKEDVEAFIQTKKYNL